MKIYKQIAFLIFVAALFCGPSNVIAQKPGILLPDKRITIQMENRSLNDVFARLTMKFDVTIGFEESLLDNGHGDYRFETDVPYPGADSYPWDVERNEMTDYSSIPIVKDHLISIDFTDSRLEEVMNEIVKQMKNYAWEINDGVINIYPVHGRNPKFEKLLDIRIAKFEVPGGVSIWDLPGAIVRLPEYQSFLTQNGLYGDTTQYTSFIRRQLPDGLKFSDLTLKELLNAITRVKRGAWIMRQRSDEINPKFVRIQL